MTSIGVIDDRDEHRQIIVDGITVTKKDQSWEVLASSPLPALEDYPTWIAQNKICALVIDEMLDELIQNGAAVDYRGHELVDYLRQRINTLPIFVITGYASDPSLRERFKDVEDIIERRDFAANYANYVPRFFRAAQQYLNVFQNEINELAEYAHKVAIGDDINEEEERRARAIQFKLETAYSVRINQEINSWLDEAKKLLEGIEQMRQNIEEKLGNE